MNKAELIDHVASNANISKSDASNALDAVVDAVGSALSQGDSVSLIGFGTFSVSERGARSGRNPRTGETIQIAASKQVRFKSGKALKDRIN
ncbi:MAG: HU family DNA-binding protein [Gammaproteobacteria bacterium]|nr:HU family DNA-binding protein [Gammaproteobacteria bacterium]MCY4227254.1 HU family DNA-binding protein [Gammaproteobacteria bacterium]